MMSLKHTCLPVLVALFIFSCQKESLETFDEVFKKTTSNNWSAAANPQNPLDSIPVGLYHNKCIEYFRVSHSNYSTADQWINSRYQIALDFFCAGSDQTFCDPTIDMDELMHIDSICMDTALFKKYISEFPSPVQGLVDSLLLNFENHKSHEYSFFKSDLVELESHVILRSDISTVHRDMLLIACQVARYSGLYWKEQINSGFYGWALPHSGYIEWARTSKADVYGAIVGYTEGGGNFLSYKRSTKGGSLTSISKATKYYAD